MKQFTVRLSDELAERLQIYARAHSEQPEDALAQLVEEGITASTATVTDSSIVSTTSEPEMSDKTYPDPWAGLRGRFTADVPDLLTHHDAYLADEALDPHASEPSAISQDDRQQQPDTSTEG